MSPNTKRWEFTADTPERLANVHQSLPERAKATVASELLQVALLLESLVKTDIPAYPFQARYTGDSGVPDFQFIAGDRYIAVEMAKVTTQNLEHARVLQSGLSEPPSHFTAADLCYPEAFAAKLRASRNGWYRFVVRRLPPQCHAWLESWNGHDTVPDQVKESFAATLNRIIDGPPIEGDPELACALPHPEIARVEGFPCEETPRDRKGWLDDAFWEEWATPLNPTLMVSPFLREDDSRMSRKQVLETAFLVPAMPPPGPTLEEENQIWLNRVLSEVQDKTQKLAGDKFQHGNEDWLVLWDRLGTADWQLQARAAALARLLASHWKPGWFSRVFVQAGHFEWQLMFGQTETAFLPDHSARIQIPPD